MLSGHNCSSRLNDGKTCGLLALREALQHESRHYRPAVIDSLELPCNGKHSSWAHSLDRRGTPHTFRCVPDGAPGGQISHKLDFRFVLGWKSSSNNISRAFHASIPHWNLPRDTWYLREIKAELLVSEAIVIVVTLSGSIMLLTYLDKSCWVCTLIVHKIIDR